MSTHETSYVYGQTGDGRMVFSVSRSSLLVNQKARDMPIPRTVYVPHGATRKLTFIYDKTICIHNTFFVKNKSFL